MVKEKVLVGFCLLAVIGGGGLWYLNQPKAENNTIKLTEAKGIDKKRLDETTEETTEQTMTPIEQARETLESDVRKTGDSAEKPKTAIIEALKYISDNKSSDFIRGSYSAHLQLTSDDMIRFITTQFLAGYELKEDSIEIYDSNADNVAQFVFEIETDSGETLAFAGNYVTGTTQLEIANFHGEPSWKYGNTPQAREE